MSCLPDSCHFRLDLLGSANLTHNAIQLMQVVQFVETLRILITVHLAANFARLKCQAFRGFEFARVQ
jgi:hypothetical protein